MEEAKYNSAAWDEEARKGNYWTLPVNEKEVQKAKTTFSVRNSPLYSRIYHENTIFAAIEV